jgi:hypothetical protein
MPAGTEIAAKIAQPALADDQTVALFSRGASNPYNAVKRRGVQEAL